MLFLLPLTSMARDDFSLCETDELMYRSCKIGKKIASFCVSKNLDEKNGYVQYRFGTKFNIELVYPKQKIHPKGLFFYGMNIFTDGAVNYISFVNKSYKYFYYERVINSREDSITGQLNEGRLENGLAIVKNGKTIKDFNCSEEITGFDSSPFPSIPLVEEEFEVF
jgi:hypothetical protein